MPGKIFTDRFGQLSGGEGLENVKHVSVNAAARVNNRAENSHQPTREHEGRSAVCSWCAHDARLSDSNQGDLTQVD